MILPPPIGNPRGTPSALVHCSLAAQNAHRGLNLKQNCAVFSGMCFYLFYLHSGVFFVFFSALFAGARFNTRPETTYICIYVIGIASISARDEYPEWGDSWEEVSHEWSSSQNYLTGEGAWRKPRGAVRWKINEGSHNCDTWDPSIHRGYPRSTRDLIAGSWEPAKGAYSGVKPYHRPRGGGGVLPHPLYNYALRLVFYLKSFTLFIRTVVR